MSLHRDIPTNVGLMERSWPLSANPEFSVLECPGYCEYKVEHWRLARDGSGRVIGAASSLTWVDAVLVACLSVVWLKVANIRFVPIIGAVLIYVWWKCSQVLSESIVLLPSLGVQLETHWGSPSFPRPLFTSRRFIPLSALQDVIINEGLRRWDVRYYLAFVIGEGSDVSLEVAYENLLPYHNVLLYTYRCLQSRIPNVTPLHLMHDE